MNNIYYDRSGKETIKPAYAPVCERLSVYGILIKEGKILLIYPFHSDHWELPGGGVDDGDEFSALKREILEETGFTVLKIGKQIHVRKQNFYADDKNIYFNSTQKFYLVDAFRENKEFKLDESEIKNTKWFLINDDLKNIIRENQIEVIRKIKQV